MRNHCKSETFVNALQILYFIQYQNVKMQQKCILEARCNDKVSKSV